MRQGEQDEGDATAQGVPTPHNPTPAPTGTKPLPKGHHKKPTFVKRGRLVLCVAPVLVPRVPSPSSRDFLILLVNFQYRPCLIEKKSFNCLNSTI